MHKHAESTSVPPVPPRRKKRKVNQVAIAKSPEKTSSTRLRKSHRRRLAPPPPPPRTVREIESQVTIDRSKEATSSAETNETRNSFNLNETPRAETRQYENTDSITIQEVNSDHNENNYKNSPSRTANPQQARPFVFEPLVRKETNKYPPLLFTLHDFQNVLPSTLQREDDSCGQSSLELANSLPSDSFLDSFESSLNDYQDELCFRVTTTNLPFERCLDRWSDAFSDRLIERRDEPSDFIFDNYIDRSNRVNIRRSSAPMCYDSPEEESPVPRLTKVRFVIDSPASSTPDHQSDEDDASRNVQFLENEEVGWSCVSSEELTEVTDESQLACNEKDIQTNFDDFGDVPFSSILKKRNGSTEWSPSKDASNLLRTICKGSFDEDEGNRDGSNGSFRGSTEFDMADRPFGSAWPEGKLKAADVSKAELSLMKSKTECCIVLIEDQAIEDNDIERDVATNEVDDGGGCSREDSTSGVCENENNNFAREETILGNDDTVEDDVDRRFELIENVNFIEDSNVNGEKSTINEIDVSDQKLTTNDVEGVTSNEIETEINEGTSSAEESVEDRTEQRLKIDSIRGSIGEYRKKLFLSESYRNMRNYCDFTSNDLEEYSEDSEENDDSKILTDTSRNSQELINADRIDNVSDIETSKRSQDTYLDNKLFENKAPIRIPVDIRRNSFLENMLSSDSNLIWFSTEIVEVHPEPPMISEEPTPDQEETELALNNSMEIDLKVQKVSEKSEVLPSKTDAAPRKSVTPKTIVSVNNKSTNELKCDVLNELVSNFSKIRLKPVKRESEPEIEDNPRVIGSTQQKNDKEGNASRSESQGNGVSLANINSDSLDETLEKTNGKIINVQFGTHSKERTYHAVPLAMCNSKIEADRNESNESARIFEEMSSCNTSSPSNALAETESAKRSENREVLSNREEDLAKMDANNGAQTRFEARSELSKVASDAFAISVNAEASIKGEGSVKRLRTVGYGEKTDARDGSRRHAADARQLDLTRKVDSDDKSAIARRISLPYCNNTDNNRAVTPVAVSDDQSRDTVTITPGKVRSFIKYYEVRREATTDKDSKVNDRVERGLIQERRSVVSIRRGLEAKVEVKSFETLRRVDRRDSMADDSAERSIDRTRKDETSATVASKLESDERGLNAIEDDYVEVRKVRMNVSPMSAGSPCAQSGGMRRKKSVKFQGGFTVIDGRNPDEDGPVGSHAGPNTEQTGMRKAPGGSKGTVLDEKVDLLGGRDGESLNADPRHFEGRETAAQIRDATRREDCTGINRFVPKPETPRLVFYCTV
ncbi:uncharacterized protein LOC143433273 [Xylocopa sonorina]|uniref:uncharacterized protein LOC143433273 n=1 Tax=Xylocopa sonorina TaxID=1818115 RepID=UPI00403AE935